MENSEKTFSLLKILINQDFNLVIEVSLCLALILVLIGLVFLFFRTGFLSRFAKEFQIDEAELGVGDQKITLRPNYVDKQIAYQIWVELSTRKIGLEIDFDDDVISEIYDSWYSFFAVTRDLIKAVPVSKFQRRETQDIIKLSIDLLNEGLRPHLTKWQAKYRRWYETQLILEENKNLDPQDIQKKYPHIDNLRLDLLRVNSHLIMYRSKMYQLVSGIKKDN